MTWKQYRIIKPSKKVKMANTYFGKLYNVQLIYGTHKRPL